MNVKWEKIEKCNTHEIILATKLITSVASLQQARWKWQSQTRNTRMGAEKNVQRTQHPQIRKTSVNRVHINYNENSSKTGINKRYKNQKKKKQIVGIAQNSDKPPQYNSLVYLCNRTCFTTTVATAINHRRTVLHFVRT